MERPLVLIVSLVLVSFCRGQKYCIGRCPNFEKKLHTGFEERLYHETMWISTTMNSISITEILNANERLDKYCKKQTAGYDKCAAWPVLITITNGNNPVLSWFVPTNTSLSEIPNSSVTLQSRPAATIYVRLFNGMPSITEAKNNAQRFCKDLIDAGKTINTHTYSGAAYEPYFAFLHHNEIWIPAA